MVTLRSPIRTRPSDTQGEVRVQPEGDTKTINSLAFKSLPPFTNPRFWFIQAEAALQMAKITSDSTKCLFLISQLRLDILSYIADVVGTLSPTSTTPCTNKSYSKIEESKAYQLLKTCRMGDEKPSHFLHRLRNLVGNSMSKTILTSIFLEQASKPARHPSSKRAY